MKAREAVALFLVALSLLAGSRSAAQISEHYRLRQARGEFVPDEVLVKFREGVPKVQRQALHAGLAAGHRRAAPRLERLRVHRVGLGVGTSVEEMVERYRRSPLVEYAEPNHYLHALAVPNDPLYGYQWHLDNPVYGAMNMEPAWDLQQGDPRVIVSIVDTGVAYEDYLDPVTQTQYARAPDLAGTAFAPGYDLVNDDEHPNDDESHGTHVAGTVGQTTNNGTGVAGTAPDCALMPVKVLDDEGTGTDADVAAGIVWAVDHGAHVVNLSLGGSSPSQVLEDAVRYAHERDVLVVAATGNDGIGQVNYPAAYDAYVTAVGATRYDETRAAYSNFGAAVDLVGPGGDVTVDQNGDGYADGVLQNTFSPITRDPLDFSYWFFQGTSMATPHVAGAAALLYAHGLCDPDEIKGILESTAEDLGPPGRDNKYGYGQVDAYAALQEAASRQWVEDVANPVFGQAGGGPKAYYPSVLYDAAMFSGHGPAARYRMWYGTEGGQTGLATSPDGVDWTDVGVVMSGGYHGNVEYYEQGFPGANSGSNPSADAMYYRIWYWDPGVIYTVAAIRYAESADGVNWHNDQPLRNGAVPIVTGGSAGWNRGSYGVCDVLYDPGAANLGTDWTFTMYYDATTGGDEAVGLAFSTDGMVWTGYDADDDGAADPVLQGSYVSGAWDYDYATWARVVKNADGRYEMWYSGGDGAVNHGIGHATSPDGIGWRKCPSNPILHVSDGVGWRGDRTYVAALIEDGNALRMWYAGKQGGTYSIGIATRALPGAAAASASTPAGTDVSVLPTDRVTGAAPVAVLFSEVTRAGSTELVIEEAGMPAPAGFRWGAPPVYYEVRTTAAFSGPVEVCIDCSGTDFLGAAGPRLFHFDGSAWIDVTTGSGEAQAEVCGTTTSLSPFAVLEPGSPLAAVTGAAGVAIHRSAHVQGDVLSGDRLTLHRGTRKHPGRVGGSLRAVGDIRVGPHNRIDGDVAAGGSVELPDGKHGGGVQIGGETAAGVQVARVVLPPLTFAVDPAGRPGVYVRARGRVDLPPYETEPAGYGPVQVGPRAALTLHSGNYYLEGLELGPGAELVLQLDDGPVTVHVAENLGFGPGARTVLAAGEAGDVLFYVRGAGPAVRIGRRARFIGTVYAPLGQALLGRGGRIEGALIAGEVELSARGEVVGRMAPHLQPGSAGGAVALRPVAAVATSAAVVPVNYPNPFNPNTTVAYYLGAPAEVRLVIFNALGQLVREVTPGMQGPGQCQVTWNGRDAQGLPVAAGAYLYRLETGSQRAIGRMLLVK